MAPARLALPAALPTPTVLHSWLRTLWNLAPKLLTLPADAVPFISPEGLHLPLGHADERQTLAAAAHAGAHTVYSRPGADGTGLRPITRALAGLLEDARIEWLAGRELPGLRRLWTSLHTVEPGDGQDAEMLMRRLARALTDERYVDPHPWVAKGRRLCFLDDAQQVLGLRDGAAVRHAASLLGNDLGQMRLPLNARMLRPWPAYRDDNQWLWAPSSHPEALAEAAEAESAEAQAPHRADAEPADATWHVYPEWDQRIGRLRRDWVTVTERPARPLARSGSSAASTVQAVEPAIQRRLAEAASAPGSGMYRWAPRQFDGDRLDLNALLRSWLARRTGGEFDPRIYQQRLRDTTRADVLLMLDTSASSADRLAPSGRSVLALTQQSAQLCSEALHGAGHRCAIRAFSSAGRAAVTVLRVKEFDDLPDATCCHRLAALQSGGSTRLGAAIRHGAALLAQSGLSRTRHLALITDGEAHDIDVHEPHYLDEDARHAVLQTRRLGIKVSCFSLQPRDRLSLTRTFGASRHHRVHAPSDLPAALLHLWR